MFNSVKREASEMNFIYRKGVLEDYSKESLCPMLAPGGDAQPADLHCRLCGATERLHLISDESVDEVLQNHFGFTEPPTGFICGSCKNHLRITVGFCALVAASFNTSSSKIKELFENVDNLKKPSSMHTAILASPTPGKTNLANQHQENPSQRQLPPNNQRKRQRRAVNARMSPIVIQKRIITECVQCRHKYPVMVKTDNVMLYICSRCNKKNQSKEGKNSGTTEMQKRCNLKGKTRLNSLPKTLHQVKPNMPSKTKLRNLKSSPKEASGKTLLRQVHKGGSVLAGDKKITENLAGNGAKYGKYLEQHIKANKRSLHINSRFERLRLPAKNIWH